MKAVNTNLTRTVTMLVVFLLAYLVVIPPVMAQSGGPYVLEWTTIDGGGGTSSGGQYKLTGTIGQPDAAYSAGEQYELLGGFWPSGPLCIVQFDDFARFAEVWLESGTGLAGDIDKDGNVDIEDLKRLADYWLSCCPYNWPLR